MKNYSGQAFIEFVIVNLLLTTVLILFFVGLMQVMQTTQKQKNQLKTAVCASVEKTNFQSCHVVLTSYLQNTFIQSEF